MQLPYSQLSFSGGMNLVSEDVTLAPDQYVLGVNVRTRFGEAETIRGPVDISDGLDVADGHIQGCYAFGNILVVFVSGRAYYKDISDPLNTFFNQIGGFLMSTTAPVIYACAVPAASQKYIRKNITTDVPTSGIIFDAGIIGRSSNVSLVVQDGINQPRLIFSDGTTRISQTYDEWDVTGEREYIPVGLQMVYFGVNLYIVSPDSKTIYRSVSGRPLDFMIAIDNNGDKVADATITSFAVDSNVIKLIDKLNDDSLLVVTSYSAYSVTPDTQNLIYGEPQFSQKFLFTAGAINQNCAVDILGDYAFIDREGLKSFNAVSQLRFEGNNSVFSLSVAKLFKGITQDDSVCAGSFDNYSFFSVKTVHSTASILVFDSIKKIFVSLDILGTKKIIQFASCYTSSQQKFYGATLKEIYELYPQDGEPKVAVIFSRGFNSRNSDLGADRGLKNVKTSSLRFIFQDAPEDGSVYIDELVNNSPSNNSYQRTIPLPSLSLPFPVQIPVIFEEQNGVVPIDIPVQGQEGQKLAYIIMWSGGATLSQLVANISTSDKPTSRQQQARIYAN